MARGAGAISVGFAICCLVCLEAVAGAALPKSASSGARAPIVPFPSGSATCALPRDVGPKDVLIDIDTPKTGSKRWRSAILQVCAARNGTLPLHVVTRARNSDECTCDRGCLVDPKHWHTGLATYVDVAVQARGSTGGNIFAITSLRSPVARVVSEWAELKIGRDMWSSVRYRNATLMKKLRADLRTYVEYAECPAHNRQTWMLAQTAEHVRTATVNFVEETGMSAEFFDPGIFYNMWYWYYNGDPDYVKRLAADESILEAAKTTLQSLTSFIITENATSWALFDRVFRNAPVFSPDPAVGGSYAYLSREVDAHNNKVSKSTYAYIMGGEPDARALRAAILDKNKHDIALYEFAQELHRTRLQHCMPL